MCSPQTHHHAEGSRPESSSEQQPLHHQHPVNAAELKRKWWLNFCVLQYKWFTQVLYFIGYVILLASKNYMTKTKKCPIFPLCFGFWVELFRFIFTHMDTVNGLWPHDAGQ